MKRQPHVLFVGGGSAGHVVPALPVMQALQAKHWQLSYAGSSQGPERDLVAPLAVPFYPLAAGKLRRYFSWQNLTDMFRTLAGIWQAFWLLGRLRPDLVFSKGGFVSVPVVVAAWLRRVPVIAHESDVSPGLANRLALPFVSALCTNFPGTHISGPRLRRQPLLLVRTGTPLRPALLAGDAQAGRVRCGAPPDKPLLLVVGGSLGARAINSLVWGALPALCARWHLVHICGPGQVRADLAGQPGYQAYEFVAEGWGDLLAAADLVVSRAGANALYELLALRKPNLLIPLGLGASRGDQIENAAFAEAAGYSKVLTEAGLNPDLFVDTLDGMLTVLADWRERLQTADFRDGTTAVIAVIDQVLGRSPDAAETLAESEA